MRIDCHVHMVGNGICYQQNPSRSYLALKSPYHKLLARVMLSSLGISQSALAGDLEQIYLAKLIEWIKSSELDQVVLLAQDWVRDQTGQIQEQLSTLYVPNDLVLKAAQNHPEILAGVSIHPARPDAIDELERCKEQGAVLMKCLPLYQCIDGRLAQYKPFWRKMQELGLPLLAHTGGELSLPVNKKDLADPAILEPVLDQGVKIIAAHAGSSSHYFDCDYLPKVKTLLRRYPNLYVDNSGMNTPIRARHLKRLLDPEFQGRVVHGSDLPIPISGLWTFLRGQIEVGDFRKICKEENLLQRDLLIKRSLGFDAKIESRLAEVCGL